MKEIKNKTIYTPDNVKKFLEVYYFEKVKVPRLIINILILLVIIYFFTKDNRLSENEALARSVAAAFIMPLRVQCFFKPSPQQKFTYNCITYFRSFQLKPHKF